MLRPMIHRMVEELTLKPELVYAGEVHEVILDGQSYNVTVTLTRAGAPDFYEMYKYAEKTGA